MSVQTEIDRISTAVQNAHLKVIEKGGTSAAPYLVANLAEAIDTIPEAGGGLPDGVSALASGTFTLSSSVTAAYTVSHGLGIQPNFYFLMAEGTIAAESFVNSIIAYFAFRQTITTSGTYAGQSMYSYAYSASGVSAGNETISESAAASIFGPDSFIINAQAWNMLRNGVKYRWLCGVIDNIQ